MARPRVHRTITIFEFDDGTFDINDSPTRAGAKRFEPASVQEVDRKVAEAFVVSRLQLTPVVRRNEFE